LKDAGLDRITISLDSLKRDVFKQMTGVDVLDRVLQGLEAAKKAGLQPIKINAVIVTKDGDFAVRRVLQEGPAVIWVRIGNTRRAELLRRIEADFSAMAAALERGETLVEIA